MNSSCYCSDNFHDEQCKDTACSFPAGTGRCGIQLVYVNTEPCGPICPDINYDGNRPGIHVSYGCHLVDSDAITDPFHCHMNSYYCCDPEKDGDFCNSPDKFRHLKIDRPCGKLKNNTWRYTEEYLLDPSWRSLETPENCESEIVGKLPETSLKSYLPIACLLGIGLTVVVILIVLILKTKRKNKFEANQDNKNTQFLLQQRDDNISRDFDRNFVSMSEMDVMNDIEMEYNNQIDCPVVTLTPDGNFLMGDNEEFSGMVGDDSIGDMFSQSLMSSSRGPMGLSRRKAAQDIKIKAVM